MGKDLTLFVKNDPTTLRIFPELAEEIGLNESILLLQIDFMLKTSDNYRDGKYWTFQSIHDLKKKYFNFWSTSTINRTIKSLHDKKLIHISEFNKKKYDKTRWFALNEEGLSKLKNITLKIDTHETGSNQNDTGSMQIDTGSNQNDTTIPETTTEITSEITFAEGKTEISEKSDPANPYSDVIPDTEDFSYPDSNPDPEGTESSDSCEGKKESFVAESDSVNEWYLRDYTDEEINKMPPEQWNEIVEAMRQAEPPKINRSLLRKKNTSNMVGDLYEKFQDCKEKGFNGNKDFVDAYVNHELKLWDTKKCNRTEEQLRLKFEKEVYLNHPIVQHFKSMTPAQRTKEISEL